MAYKLGCKVVAKRNILDDRSQVARPGDLGVVVEIGQFPTVRFYRTGLATIVDPLDEIELSREGVVWC